MKTKQPRQICVIGAGLSGLVTAKTFQASGHSVTMYERSGELGGVWAPSRSYPGIQTQTPRDLYAFSDFPMPVEFPEWPSGQQVYQYLSDYADQFGIRPLIRFNTAVTHVTPRADGQPGWDVTTTTQDGPATTQAFDFVAICNGTFSNPNEIHHPGREEFEANGGLVIHSSQYTDPAMIKGKRVLVLGFSKSATDVAVNAVKEGAAETTLVYRQPVWKIPYFFGNALNFKNILYSRAAESLFPPYRPNGRERLMTRLSKPMAWLNWRMLESLLKLQFGLKQCDMVPNQPIESQISCSLSIETPGFYKMVRQGEIKAERGTIEAYNGRFVHLTNGRQIEADVVIMAIGWVRQIPFLAPDLQAKLTANDGLVRLYRSLVNPDLPHMGFVGYSSSFATSLTSEIGANWLVQFIEGQLAVQPTPAEMHQEIEEMLHWRRTERPIASEYSGLCIAPYHYRYLDSLMRDMGAKYKPTNPLQAQLAPINPAVYQKLLATRPA
jgi:dimethylaniline monooxygenase (N-oxide forming)